MQTESEPEMSAPDYVAEARRWLGPDLIRKHPDMAASLTAFLERLCGEAEAKAESFAKDRDLWWSRHDEAQAQLSEARAEVERLKAWLDPDDGPAWNASKELAEAFERGKEEGRKEQREKDATFLENVLNSGPPNFWPVNSYQKTILVGAAQAIRGER